MESIRINSKPLALTAICAAAVAIGVGTWFVVGSDEDGTQVDGSPGAGDLVRTHAHGETIGSLTELIASSDIAARGVVEGISPGRRIEEEPGSALEYENVTVRLERQYWSADDSTPEAIVLEQRVSDGGKPVIENGLEPLSRGQEVVLFLKRVDASLNPSGDTTYVVRAGLGRFLVNDDSSLTGPELEDPVVDEIEGMDVSELEEQVGRLVSNGLVPQG